MQRKKGDLFWQMYANVYDLVRFLPPYQNILQDVKKVANIKSKAIILDAGCGTGNFIQLEAPNREIEFVGIDASEAMLAKAKKKLDSFPNVNLLRGNLNEKLSFSDNYFDTIIAINSLYAVIDPRFTLSELIRILKPYGTLVVVNPHSEVKFTTTYFQILNSGKGLHKLFLFIVTLPLFFFNMLIKIKANEKVFHFLSQDDWKKFIKSFNIKSLTIKQTYMQSYLLNIRKKG